MNKKEKKHCEFSKIMLKQESALIWIISISFLLLAFYCIYKGFTGTLPWLAAMIGFPWTAYGVSQAFYYSKSTKENTCGGIKYETAVLEAKSKFEQMNSENVANAAYDSGVDYEAQFNAYGTYSKEEEYVETVYSDEQSTI